MERSAFTNGEKSAVINEPVLQGRYKYEYLLSRDKEVDSLKLLTRFISLIPLSRGVLDRLDPKKEEGREERS
jgi:hypothetical protein